ncbi:hypothetical protein [Actinokineospora diospyrosa]|uniref:Integrase n=1 Tax=Actinokineospora diospyrosa TaxID=103728 RepID=A0ABT1I6H7_9PSEU|nr:hypothetical protein [Actinokineospora diospyrosa]MCP2268176.1 hypothetical protein [Actinokineospora diospyrosa]
MPGRFTLKVRMWAGYQSIEIIGRAPVSLEAHVAKVNRLTAKGKDSSRAVDALIAWLRRHGRPGEAAFIATNYQ